MRTILTILFFQILILSAQTVPVYDYGMNCQNTYRDRTGEPVYSLKQGDISLGIENVDWTGEYQIFFDQLGALLTPHIMDSLYLSIEAVSFPFVPDFNDYPNTPGTRRHAVVLNPESSHHFSDNVTNDLSGYGSNLCINFFGNIPSHLQTVLGQNKRWEQIDYGTGMWNYPVYLKFSQRCPDIYTPTTSTDPCNNAHGKNGSLAVNAWSTLISAWFGKTGATFFNEPGQPRVVFPHTVLKHTFWYKQENQWVSHSFIVDWTRGIFRSYPFTSCNTTSTELTHDISLDAWLGFDDNNIDTTCSSIGYVANRNISGYNGGGTSSSYTYPTVSNEDIVIFKVKNSERNLPAGYKDNGSGQLTTLATTPCYHKYFIDKSIDLTKINPIEKVIYHPSEVTIKSGVNIVFPSCYVFRTVRSTYPKASDLAHLNPANVNGWNSIHNGGPYYDLRDIPVPTDLSPTSDANDASVYIVENGAEVILQDGVTVYDCTFKIKPGGSISNYDSKEIAGRFKIQWLDGANNVIQEFVINKPKTQINKQK